MPRTITIAAPAKLNLALSVGASVADPERPAAGPMHPICSWMVTIDLFDELTLTQLEDGRLSRYAILWHKDARRRSEINWSITKDLAVRAHLAMERHVQRSLPVQMKLEKRIPVAGGLGGGSSDAAAMLRGLNELFELQLQRDELARLAANLGSDVPFLVHGGSAIVEGLGEQITRQIGIPSLNAVVAFPKAACPTGKVYALFDELGSMGNTSLNGVRRAAVLEMANRPSLQPDAPFNDLTQAALRAAPSLEDDLKAMTKLAERPAHMSGSGSTLFVLCDDPMHASALAEAVDSTLGIPAVAVRTCEIPCD